MTNAGANHRPKWVAQVLMGVVMLLIGGAAGNLFGERTAALVKEALSDHEQVQGHQVLVERVNRIEQHVLDELEELNEELKRIRALVERQ